MTWIHLPQPPVAPKNRRVAPLCQLRRDALHCFVCGGGASAGKLVGSGHPKDWVHPHCLAAPLDWGAEEKAP